MLADVVGEQQLWCWWIEYFMIWRDSTVLVLILLHAHVQVNLLEENTHSEDTDKVWAGSTSIEIACSRENIASWSYDS